MADVLGRSVHDIKALLATASYSGVVHLERGDQVTFSHERQKVCTRARIDAVAKRRQVAAYRLLPEDTRLALLSKAANFLRQPHLVDDYFYESAKLSLIGRSLGAPLEESEELISLLLRAIRRATLTGSFNAAKELLDSVEGLFEARIALQRPLTDRQASSMSSAVIKLL